MSREGMLGRIPLALHHLSNDGLNEALALVHLIGGNDGPAWIAHLEETRKTGLPQKQTLPLLVPVRDIKLAAFEGGDPRVFYKNREGLFLFPEFQRLVSTVRRIERFESTLLRVFETTRKANDHDIKKELPDNHEYDDESELCAHIEQMISLQSKGEKGSLLTNDCENLFYLTNQVVSVFWDAKEGRWRIRSSKLNNRPVNAGRYVFSRS